MIGDREARHLALMLAPYLAGIAVLIAFPAAVTFVLALYEYDLIRSPRFVGLANFRELVDDEVFRISLRNSLLFMAFAVPLRLLGALALALLLQRRYRGVGAYRTAAYLPSVVPDVAYALLWLWIFKYGPLNLALQAIGGPTPRWMTDPRAAQWAIVIMSLFLIGEGFLVALATRPEPSARAVRDRRARGREAVVRVRPRHAPAHGADAPAPALPRHDLQLPSELRARADRDGGRPAPVRHDVPAAVRLPKPFEYLRYGYAAAATLVMFLATAALVYVQYRTVRSWRHAFAV